MKTRTWYTIDKQEWGPGQWTTEPDKQQWTDPRTHLPCLAVRNYRLGHWCGYVGIDPSHPWFGTGYNKCTRNPECEEYCVHSPSSRIKVHGGLTFSDRCHTPNKKEWKTWADRLKSRGDEAQAFPDGDAAFDIRHFADAIHSYDSYVEMAEATFICHIPDLGEPSVWWFGFDCAHVSDLSPGLNIILRHRSRRTDIYRNLNYVTGQCAKLARQLAQVQGVKHTGE